MWIKCSERLPEKSGWYFIISKRGCYNALEFSVKHGCFNASDDSDYLDAVIECEYWMPIPAVPKGGEKE
ncbi:MAG: DUF551 domain-containing protein [Erysipelotrichaceae bacterium]|nr:DUF551 domain-containing protein [Erysipelotrichaceae bacterium]MBQ2510312.1 DUF551 domain-containing protein [Erysipelotrichaceae bacterium]